MNDPTPGYMIAPLAKTGVISDEQNLIAAAILGFGFGFILQRTGFTDGRKIARVFYLKEIDVPIVMFSAIVTASLGLWGLSLIGLIDISKVYLLPTFLAPMVVGGLLFGVGMVTGGYCPGTAAASVSTGKLDALVFLVGFFAGSLIFGDLFPIWEHFYASDDRGTWRLDQMLDINLGSAVLLITVVLIAVIWSLHRLQSYFWSNQHKTLYRTELPLTGIGLLLAIILAFFPTNAFIEDNPEPDFYIIPRQESAGLGPRGDPVEGEGVAGVARAGLMT